MKTRKTATLGMLCAGAVILGYIEMMIPVMPSIPGMKLGLPNLAVVSVLYLYSFREAAAVSFVRILIIGLLFGNLFSICFSLAGAALSLLIMGILKKMDFLDCIGVSLAGGIGHNLGQIAVAAVLVENIRVAYYFIPLMISGLVSGILIGILSGIIAKRLKGAASDFHEK